MNLGEEAIDATPPQPPRTSGLAVASLIVGIAGLVCLVPVISPVLAVVFGFIALSAIRNSGTRLTGKGLAVSGVVCGILGLILDGVIAVSLILGYRFVKAEIKMVNAKVKDMIESYNGEDLNRCAAGLTPGGISEQDFVRHLGRLRKQWGKIVKYDEEPKSIEPPKGSRGETVSVALMYHVETEMGPARLQIKLTRGKSWTVDAFEIQDVK